MNHTDPFTVAAWRMRGAMIYGLKAVTDGLKQIATAGLLAAKSMRHLSRTIAILEHGPHNVDHNGHWLSNLCAAWVHEACPAARHCDCRCHT